MRTTISVMALLAAAACGQSQDGSGRWLTAPDQVTHARFFPLAGTLHDAIDCNACHGAFDSFRQFDCVTCHNGRSSTPDAIHLGTVVGYVSPPFSAECLQCHPTGTSVMADHGRFFPIGTGTKHVLGCSQCHGTPRSDITLQQCSACHTSDAAKTSALASQHSSRAIGTDYGASSPLPCLRCHADGTVTSVAGHPSFRGESLPHHSATCFTCHPRIRTDLVTGMGTSYAADFASDPAACANLAPQTGCYAASCHAHTSCPPN